VLEIASEPDSLVLDSFAGSGTTAHAVLSANSKDGGARRFILVESEDYADRLTAERVRRVIKGYAFAGMQREELLHEKINWTQLQKAEKLLARVEEVKRREGFDDKPDLGTKGVESRRFDRIGVSVKEGELIVEGEKKISERVEGLGGEFTYCTLGEPLDPEGILSGKTLPDYESLGSWLYYAATGGTLDRSRVRAGEYYLGEALDKHLWLIYKADMRFLKSAEAALTLTFARNLREKTPDKPHLVFAAAKFLSNRQLLEHGVEYAALPYSLYRGA
jgi:adenine-specific DNA-methyltransferase